MLMIFKKILLMEYLHQKEASSCLRFYEKEAFGKIFRYQKKEILGTANSSQFPAQSVSLDLEKEVQWVNLP